MADIKCPICLNEHGGQCTTSDQTTGDYTEYTCELCGTFRVTRSALASRFLADQNGLTIVQRATLAHYTVANQSENKLTINTDVLERLAAVALPSPAAQASAIIRLVGDHIVKSGKKLKVLPDNLYCLVGASNPDMAFSLAKELHERSLLTGILRANHMRGAGSVMEVSLSLNGWERYEADKRGKIRSRVAFIALKFGVVELDNLLTGTIKPAIKELNYELVDMRDVAQPGVIDNVLRDQIRQAPFVLVDLTHDNSGAYWEAGYAEGLGKPVLYLCEKEKFDAKKTHFDTNHCTTVTWGGGKSEDNFKRELQATLRNSLRIFPE